MTRETLKTRVGIVVRGWVQGVGFRMAARETALRLGLSGWVTNLPDGRTVAIEIEGGPADVQAFTDWARTGPPSATVLETSVTALDVTGDEGFFIRH